MAVYEATGRFPFISLEKALVRTQQLFDNDKRGKPMAIHIAFEIWGYSPKSSGGFQTIGALKAYGLLMDEGSGPERKVRLSEAALQYFLDERDEERGKLLTRFALAPRLFASLWRKDRWSDGIPGDTVARSHLKLERKLNEQSARSVLSIMKENVVFSGLTSSGTVEDDDPEVGRTEEAARGLKIGDFVQHVSGENSQFLGPRQVLAVSADGRVAHVKGTSSPVPVSELRKTQAPGQGQGHDFEFQRGDIPLNPIEVFISGSRLRITADVDLEGIRKLKRMLEKYEEILSMDEA